MRGPLAQATPAHLGETSRSDRCNPLIFSLRRELLAWAKLLGFSSVLHMQNHANSSKTQFHTTSSSKHQLNTWSCNSITQKHILHENWVKS